MATKKRFNQTAAAPAKPNSTQDPAIYAATYWRSALRMATLRALVVLSGMAAIAAGAGAAVALVEGIEAAAAGLALLAVVIGVWAISLNSYTTSVARATWYQIEQARGEDLDGDGYIGDPTRTVKVGGKEPTEITLDLPPSSITRAPILRPFGVSAPDLVSFLFEAKLSRGLQERQWVGKGVRVYVLPSGTRVTQELFRTLVAECAKVGWAAKEAGRWELKVDPETVAQRLHAQMQPAETPAPPRRGRV